MSKKLFAPVLFLVLCSVTHCQHDESNEIDPLDEIYDLKYLFLFGGIFLVAIIRHLTRAYNIYIPYSIFTILFGLIWGVGSLYNTWMARMASVSTKLLHNLTMVYLPIIIYSIAFCLDVHSFLKCLPQILVIAIPVSLLSGTITGMLMRLIIDPSWDIVDGMVFGVMTNSIYPMDILHWLKETSIQNKLVTSLLEGETLLAASVSKIVWTMLLANIQGWIVYWYQFVMTLVRLFFMGVPLGYLFGLLGVSLMKFSYNDTVILMLLTISMCYTSYYTVEWLANGGICGTMITGIMMGQERVSLSKEIEREITDLWKVISFIINGVLFFNAGVVAPIFLKDSLVFQDYVLVFVTYLITNMARFICFFLFSPILSRLGYGMSFENMIICVWCGLKNPVNLKMTLDLDNVYDSYKAKLFFLHNLCMYTLLLFINGSLLPLLLDAIGLSEISIVRQVNMNNCMNYIYEARARTIAILKMDRFLSDANWPLVLTSTSLKHPYKKVTTKDDESDSEDEKYFLARKYTFCSDCQKNIPNEPTPKEMKEMYKEAKLRILKLKKTIYSRQYENGMISKGGLRTMHQAVETAMDTEEAVIELDGLFKMFTKEGCFYRFLRNRLQTMLDSGEDSCKPPRKPWRLWCFRIIHHSAFTISMNVVVLVNIVCLAYHFGSSEKFGLSYYVHVNGNLVFFAIYFLEFFLKIFAYSWIYIWQHGIPTYFKSHWNLLEFIILLFSFTNVIIDSILLLATPHWFLYFVDIALSVLLALRLSRICCSLKLCILCQSVPATMIKYLNAKVDKHRALAYELGKNYIAGEEEILENLPQIIDNDKIRESIKERLESDRLAVTRRLGLAQKEGPWVVTTVKTKSAVRTILCSMKEDVNELRVSGWVDDVEYNRLLTSLADRYRHVHSVKSIQPSPPRLIFKEVPFMGDNSELIEFMYTNVTTKKYEPGEVVYAEGEVVDGIYVLITGMLVVSYQPQEDVLEKLKDIGALPVVDYLCSLTYDEPMYDYIVPGNTIGEISTLTERPYNGVVKADTQSQMYVINRSIVKRALEMDPDPVNGLECRIWKCVVFRKAVAVMMNVPAYRSYTQEKLKYILERSFVPDLSYYKVFEVNEMMEDIILIEGMVVDFNTRDVYTGPCYIPRAVQKLVFPKSSFINIEVPIETKLMIIPAKDYDEYEIMLNEEEICDIVQNAPNKCLHHLIQERSLLSTKCSKSLKLKIGMKGLGRKMKRKMPSTTGSIKSRITFSSSSKSVAGLSQRSQ